MKKLIILGLASFAVIATNGMSPALADDDSYGRNAYQRDPLAPPAGCMNYSRTTGQCLQAAPGYLLDPNGLPRLTLPARPPHPAQLTQPTQPDQPPDPSVEPTDSEKAPQ